MAFDAHGSVQGAPSAQPISSTPTQAPAPEPKAAPTPTPAPAQNAQAPAPRQAAATEVTPEATKWEPNFKFKVMDKEHEIDEFLRGAIKDSETEKRVRELYEKAYGLDVVKPRFNETREKLRQLNETHTGVMAGIQELRELYSRGDFDSFFTRLNIPQEKILQWVVEKAQYNELPPEQRQVLDARRKAEQEAWELRKHTQSLQQQYESALVQARDSALQVELARPDVRQFAQAFDSKGFKRSDGSPVRFLDAVIEAGEYAWYASKGTVDLSPAQAIQEVMARWGASIQPQQPDSPPIVPTQGATQAAPVQAPRKTGTLPNVAGRQTSSVAKSKPKSIEELKKLAAQMGG